MLAISNAQLLVFLSIAFLILYCLDVKITQMEKGSSFARQQLQTDEPKIHKDNVNNIKQMDYVHKEEKASRLVLKKKRKMEHAARGEYFGKIWR